MATGLGTMANNQIAFTGNYGHDINMFKQTPYFQGLSLDKQGAALNSFTNNNYNVTTTGGAFQPETTTYSLKAENYGGSFDGTTGASTANTSAGTTGTATNSMADMSQIGGILNGVLQFGQLALAAFDTWQSYQALQEAKEQFAKQLKFSEQNANNRVITTNNRINSAVNIKSALQNKSPEEAAKALQQSKEKYNVKEIHVS